MYNTIGPILENTTKKEAIEFLKNFVFSECKTIVQEIKYARYIASYQGINLYYDYGADYYFFAVKN